MSNNVNDELKNLGNFLKELRINCGYTRADVADHLDMHVNTIKNIEKSRNFTIKNLLQLAQFYNLNSSTIFNSIET